MVISKQIELGEYFEASPDSVAKKDVGMQLLSNPRSVVSKIEKKLPASEQARKTRSSQKTVSRHTEAEGKSTKQNRVQKVEAQREWS